MKTFSGRDEIKGRSTVSINFAKWTCAGKTTISNHERWSQPQRINGPDKEKKRSMVVVHFAMRTSKVEDQNFTLQKVMGPAQIDGYMERLIVINDREPSLV